MKGIISPVQNAMPSPTFLWRFKTMMVWLWGVNLWVFLQSTVSYTKVFDLDQNHLTHREMWKVVRFFAQPSFTWMTIIVPTSMTAYLYLYSHGEVSLAASQPVLLYILVAVILIFPFDIFYLSSRYFFLRTLLRIALPLQPITFPDFFVADILTSMAKVATIAWLEADSVCGSHSVAIPMVLVLPYMWRLLQCLRHGFSRIFKFNKSSTVSNMLYGRQWIYFWVIGSNFVLRCSWTYKLSAHLRHNYLTVFAITLMEMLRRFQWIFFRVENEWNKITRSGVQLTEIPREEEKLLGSNIHDGVFNMHMHGCLRIVNSIAEAPRARSFLL
ncbi:hypothetical protein V8G54_020953 [Vigna mungo]|uniref:EXS domain-containing protein n=1 Tax=Vigna mungo TaxID=3915 RepID=A0AAQ3RV81_VIGMU